MIATLPFVPVQGFAACGAGSERVPPARVVAAFQRRRGAARLPSAGTALARAALGGRTLPPAAGVLIGTAFGCIHETEQFLLHMLAEHEALPKPRAFSQSVHGAIAAQIAIELSARGETQTFAHGETSFAHAVLAAQAVLARAPRSSLLLGALDEGDSLLGRTVCAGLATATAENGAVLWCDAGADAGLEIGCAALGGERLGARVPDVLAAQGVAHALFVPSIDGGAAPAQGLLPFAPAAATFAGAPAAAAAALAVLAGEAPAAGLGAPPGGDRIGIVVASRLGDLAVLIVRRRPAPSGGP